MPLGLKMLACWIAFSESPSETTWLENALFRLNPRRLDLATFGIERVTSSPEEFAAFIRSQIETWARQIKAAGIEPE